jgi:multidrug resistance efflux pump
MRGKWLLISVAVVLAAVAAGALALWWRERPRQSANPAKAAPPPVAVSGAVTLTGKIQAQHVTLVGTPVEGTVEEFLADVGQEVFEGQLLARITNTGLETTHEKARNEAESASSRLSRLEGALSAARLEASRASADRTRARAELERTRKSHLRQKLLHSEGATPRLAFERAEREFAAAEADAASRDEVAKVADERVASLLKDIDAARRVLDDKNRELEDAQSQLDAEQVHAPVDGIVVGRRGLPGDAVNRDVKDLFQIAVDLGLLSVVLTPEPSVAAAIRPGTPATIQIAELGGEALQGAVAAVAGDKVTVEFASPTPLIKPGMTASVRLNIR